MNRNEVFDAIHFLDNDGKNLFKCKEDLSEQTLKDLAFAGYDVRKASYIESLSGLKYIITWDDIKQMRLDFVSVRCDVILRLESKHDWVRSVPDKLPKKATPDEIRLFVDANGCVLTSGKDFESARVLASYPVTVYRLKTATEFLKLVNQTDVKL